MKNKKIKILMISASSKLGGGPIHMFMLGKNLKKDFEVYYALPKSKNFLDNLPKNKFIFIKERSIVIKDLLNIKRFIKQNKIDIIHAHGKGASVLGRILKIFTRKPLVYTPHGIHVSCHKIFKRITYLIYEYLTGFLDTIKIFVSLSEKNYAYKLGILNKANYKIINNGVDNRVLKSSQETIREFLQNNSNISVKVISICRFVKQKNIKEIIEIARICETIDFYILGDGPLFNDIENLISNYQLKNISLVGKTKNVFKYLYSSDIFLSTSIYEGLPISVLEAMSIGLPVIASKVTGNVDTIQHAFSGYFYQLKDIYSASKYINILSKDKSLRLKMGKSAFTRQKKLFSTKKMIASYEVLYNEIIKKSDF